MPTTIAARAKMPLYELLNNEMLGKWRNPIVEEMNKALSVVAKAKYKASGMPMDEFAKRIGVSVPRFFLIIRCVSRCLVPAFGGVDRV
jgi:hypothetical protein